MELTFRSAALFSAVALTGLSAGLFYAWTVSVIPGTRKVIDITYLETMRSINRAILNPAFFLVFFGPILTLALSTVQQFRAGLTGWLLLGATLTYLIGTFGVTAFGNVPLNDALEALDLATLSEKKVVDFRRAYESRWNRLHLVRTLFALLSFLLAVLAVFSSPNP